MNLRIPRPVQDERTIAVGHASHFWAYVVLTTGLFVHMILGRANNPRDLLALMVISGMVAAIYQTRKKAFPWRWILGIWAAIIPLQALVVWLVIRFVL